MIYNATFLFCLIVAPLVVNLRGWSPAALFLAAAAVYILFGSVSFAQTQLVLSQIRDAEPAYYDTYYVVGDGNFLWSIVMAACGAITWIQTRFGAMRHPDLTKILFWILHVSLIGSTFLPSLLFVVPPKPRRYIDYQEVMETYASVSAWSGIMSKAALVALLCLLLWSVTAGWFTRQR
ncbi:MAG: hypothetical protein MK180_03050 [Rhodobacteraceae bacterium]|nr:hypothetical protein [Paracoccaceae bacterium]